MERPVLDALYDSLYAMKLKCFEFHVQLMDRRVTAVCVAVAEIHRCQPRDSMEVWRATDQNIAATEAFPWHFLIYERRSEIPAVSKVERSALAPRQYRHATGRLYYSRFVSMALPSYHRYPPRPLRLAVPTHVWVLKLNLLKREVFCI